MTSARSVQRLLSLHHHRRAGPPPRPPCVDHQPARTPAGATAAHGPEADRGSRRAGRGGLRGPRDGGGYSSATCSPSRRRGEQDRLGKRALEDRAAALAERRAELSAAATATFDGFDLSDRALRRIASDLRSAADNAPDQLRKSVAQAFVDGPLVVGRRTVKPTFRVLPGVPRPRTRQRPSLVAQPRPVLVQRQAEWTWGVIMRTPPPR